ncbi:MAG TPA: hypothetical protein VG537_10930 [Candidatus Kapabacteria bacterium]|jgi:hypothetical protein|nr:hypothetical protein [Candidatus Kapabacteria bacterium]
MPENRSRNNDLIRPGKENRKPSNRLTPFEMARRTEHEEAKGTRMGESLKEKMESALTQGFERAQEDKVKELNRLSRTGKRITRKDYNSRNLADLYRELGLEYPSGKPLNDFQKN